MCHPVYCTSWHSWCCSLSQKNYLSGWWSRSYKLSWSLIYVDPLCSDLARLCTALKCIALKFILSHNSWCIILYNILWNCISAFAWVLFWISFIAFSAKLIFILTPVTSCMRKILNLLFQWRFWQRKNQSQESEISLWILAWNRRPSLSWFRLVVLEAG